MIKGISRCILSLGILSLLISGCGTARVEDASDLTKKMIDTLQNKKQYTYDLSLDIEIVLSSGKTNLTLDFNMNSLFEVDTINEALHAIGEMKVKSLGVDQTSPYEMYLVKQDDKYILYNQVDTLGTWKQQELQSTISFDLIRVIEQLKESEDLEYDGTSKVGDEDAFVVLATIPSSSLDGFNSISLSENSENNNLFDSSKNKDIPIKMELSQTSFEPLRFTLDTTDSMTPLINGISSIDVFDGFKADVSSSQLVVTFNKNQVVDIKVPEHVRKQQ